jgi:hypothetical protein
MRARFYPCHPWHPWFNSFPRNTNSCLNITGLDVALLLNFKEATLKWKRVIRGGTLPDE